MKRFFLLVLVAVVILLGSCTKPDVFEPVINNNSTPEYSSTDTIGESGTGDGQLSMPRSVMADGNYLYVNDYGNGRIAKFTLAGRFVKNIPLVTSRAYTIYHTCFNARGNIFVLDYFTFNLRELSKSGALVHNYGMIAPGTGKLAASYSLRDITAAKTGHFYILDYDGTIYKYDSNANHLRTFGGTGTENGKFQNATDIVVGPDNLIYVLDADSKNVQVLTPQGDFVRKWGDDILTYPYAIGIDNVGYVYVVDSGTNEVFKFKPTGELITSWDIPITTNKSMPRYNGIDIDDMFKVYAADGIENKVYVFSGE